MQHRQEKANSSQHGGRFPQSWRAIDALIAAFLLIMTIIDLIFSGRIGSWHLLIAANAAVIFIVWFLARSAARSPNRILHFIYDWYPAPLIFLSFKEIYVIIRSLNPADLDHYLILVDRKIFGTDPTVWIGRFAAPAVTEILQLAYAGYFIILFAAGIELYRWKDLARFEYYFFLIAYGFFVSYIGYILVPAIGPRFTLHNFADLDNELPGLWLTVPIRNFLNSGESIPLGAADAWRHAQRDAFPSGHTELTLLSLYLCFHWKLRSRWYLLVMGTLLIISTVYLRYHYVIDLFGGAVVAVFCIVTAKGLNEGWERIRIKQQ